MKRKNESKMSLKKLEKKVVKHIFSMLEDQIIDQLTIECETQVCCLFNRFSFLLSSVA